MNPSNQNLPNSTFPHSYPQYKPHDNLAYPPIPHPYSFDPRYGYYPVIPEVSNYPVGSYPAFPASFHLAYPQHPLLAPVMPPQGSLLNNFAMIGDIIKKLDNDSTEKGHRDYKEHHRSSKIKKKEKEIKLGTIVFKPSKGDWQCSAKSCQNWNYAKRQKCNLCGANKDGHRDRRDPNQRFSDSRDDLKARSPNETDWKCGKCGFGNYQNKEECYKCSERKPRRVNDGHSQPE